MGLLKTPQQRKDEILNRLLEIPDEGGLDPKKMDKLMEERFKLEQELAGIEFGLAQEKNKELKAYISNLDGSEGEKR